MKSFKFAIKLLFSISFAFVLFECGLRLFPAMIPLRLLIHFHDELRSEIAEDRNLPLKKNSVSLERDDEGPDLQLLKPFTELVYDFQDPGSINRVVMDDMGFCNATENSYHLPHIDVITIGDSFTWCTTVEPQDTWTSQLSKITNFSTYNLGRSGKGVYEYIQILKHYGLQKSPNVVVMNIYGGNDLRDAVRYASYRDRDTGEIKLSIDPIRTFDGPLHTLLYYPHMVNHFFKQSSIGRGSYAFNMVMASARYFRALFLESLRSEENKFDFRYHLMFADTEIPFNLQNLDKDEVAHARLLRRGEIDLNLFAEALNTFVDLSRQYGFVPMVTYTPSAFVAYDQYVSFSAPDLGELMPWFDRQQRQYFKAQGEELGYIFVDLTPALQTAARSLGAQKLLYYQTNLHLTSHGHKVVAKVVAHALDRLDRAREGELYRSPISYDRRTAKRPNGGRKTQ